MEEQVKTAVEPTPKTKTELIQEYTNACALAGDKAFQVKMLESDIGLHTRQMSELLTKIKKLEADEKAAPALEAVK